MGHEITNVYKYKRAGRSNIPKTTSQQKPTRGWESTNRRLGRPLIVPSPTLGPLAPLYVSRPTVILYARRTTSTAESRGPNLADFHPSRTTMVLGKFSGYSFVITYSIVNYTKRRRSFYRALMPRYHSSRAACRTGYLLMDLDVVSSAFFQYGITLFLLLFGKTRILIFVRRTTAG